MTQETQKRTTGPFWGICAVLMLALIAGGGWRGRRIPEAERTPQEIARHAPSRNTTPSVTEDSIMALVSTDATPAGNQTSLDHFRRTLSTMSPSEAVQLIRSFLRGGRDKATGMEFELTEGGNLKSWPTLRTFLLDVVSSIDPLAAGEISREILAAPTSADEWALALRNLGRLERSAEGDRLLREKTVELIHNPSWQANPSVGYLNAFDVLVHIEATAETPLLSTLIQRKYRRDLAHAGFLTLDRLVQCQPTDMLERLAADESLRQSRPEMSAQEFARADLRDPAQREIVKHWLLDPSRSPAELRCFASTYPNSNCFVSNNLLTVGKPVPGAELAAHDREALAIVAAWENDPAFQTVREHLQSILTRLDGFVKGTKQESTPNH